jgi:hypothetical protein
MKSATKSAITCLTVAGALAAASTSPAVASAPPGGCPLGGGWQLVSADVGPAAMSVDEHGNHDGLVCKTVFVNGSGATIAQVIDNDVQAPQ